MASSILVLLVLICALAWIAERVRLPPPVFYLAGGAFYGLAQRRWGEGDGNSDGGGENAPSDNGADLFGFLPDDPADLVPTLPPLPYDSGVVFAVFFPVLLYGAAFRMPWNDFRVNAARSIFFGLSNVVVTLAVGAFAHHVFGLPWALAFLFGVCLADPDFSFFLSRADETNTSRPLRRAVTSEGLVEGTAMLLLYLALSDVVTGGETIGSAFAFAPFALEFALSPVIGAIVGTLVARACVPAFRTMRSPTLAVAASLALPFLAYLPAQALGGVRLAAVVAAGFVSGQRIDPVMSPGARQMARAAWDALAFLVNGAIYVPAGALLTGALADADVDWTLVAWGAPVVALFILAVRAVWAGTIFGAMGAIGRPLGPWPDMAMGTLGATRGVFALASALALPTALASGAPVPDRDLVIALAWRAAAASLVVQAPIILIALRRIPLRPDGREVRERALAYAETARAALDALPPPTDRSAATDPGIEAYRVEMRSILDRYDGEALAPAGDVNDRLAAMAAQRERLHELRDADRISGETFLAIEGEIDRHETYLRGE